MLEKDTDLTEVICYFVLKQDLRVYLYLWNFHFFVRLARKKPNILHILKNADANFATIPLVLSLVLYKLSAFDIFFVIFCFSQPIKNIFYVFELVICILDFDITYQCIIWDCLTAGNLTKTNMIILIGSAGKKVQAI